jgi:hypothetical protein
MLIERCCFLFSQRASRAEPRTPPARSLFAGRAAVLVPVPVGRPRRSVSRKLSVYLLLRHHHRCSAGDASWMERFASCEQGNPWGNRTPITPPPSVVARGCNGCNSGGGQQHEHAREQGARRNTRWCVVLIAGAPSNHPHTAPH